MGTPWPFVALATVLGLVIGSFLNVVIYRVPRGESLLFPASHCPTCGEDILVRHNVPVLGWLWLRGRCANCASNISARYPLVEAGTGALFAAITLRLGLTAELPAYLYLAAVGIALALIDMDLRRLPDTIVLPSYIVGMLLLLPAGAVNNDLGESERACLGMLAMIAIYFVLAIAYPTVVEFGDVKVAGLMGLYLGWLSWGALLLGILISFVLVGVGGSAVNAVAARRTVAPVRAAPIATATAIPLGTCLMAATALSLFAVVPVSTWYASLLSS